MNEFDIIRRFFDRPARRALAGVGDDCALVPAAPDHEIALTTDMLVEGRHFPAGAAPRALGHKALAVNLSDLAAAGASPRWALLALSMPEADPGWVGPFADGLFSLAERHGVELVGGDTTRGPRTITITAIGEVPSGRALRRSGARPGDDVWVSGALGGAALGLRRPEIADARRRLERPEPRVGLGERLRGLAHAAIDVSDGFAQDLGHILERSGVGARIELERLPRDPAFAGVGEAALVRECVLSGGDDYELVFTASPERRDEIASVGRDLGLPLARVGTIVAGAPALELLDAGGEPIAVPRGYDHFAE